jgi:hypothetical protein
VSIRAWYRIGLGLGLLSCGHEPPSAPQEQNPPLATSLTLGHVSPLVFDALGDTARLAVVALDSLGQVLAEPKVAFQSSDPSVVEVLDSGLLRTRGNGSVTIVARDAGGASDSVRVSVTQVMDSLDVALTDSQPIISVALWAPLPLTCVARDRNGYALATAPQVSGTTGATAGASCADLVARHSGPDTLHISAGSQQRVVPLFLAIRPLLSSPLGSFLALDSFPAGAGPWAPTLRRNSLGSLELYVTAYQVDTTAVNGARGDLHRWVSSDGNSFHYDGVVLTHAQDPCNPQGTGIEHVAIVPRSDAAGWRMFYAAGGYGCLNYSGAYGWQVYSAVSSDERHWTPEPGVRIDNGGPMAPAPALPGGPPWPAGEGMVMDRLPSGDWRMIVGSYERIQPRVDEWAITRWDSPDQLHWSYQGPLITTRNLPFGGQRSVGSPTIRQVRTGLYRMFFAADDTNLPGGRGRLFSAVSTDLDHWVFEGELMGDPSTSLLYCTMENDLLVFLRQDQGDARRLASVRVIMN